MDRLIKELRKYRKRFWAALATGFAGHVLDGRYAYLHWNVTTPGSFPIWNNLAACKTGARVLSAVCCVVLISTLVSHIRSDRTEDASLYFMLIIGVLLGLGIIPLITVT